MNSKQYSYTGKELEEWFLRTLSWCHNMLRNKANMTSESAFKELNKILYIKYITEKDSIERLDYQALLTGEGQIYPDERFDILFDEVKRVFEQECLFDYAEHVTANSSICSDIIEALRPFDYSATNLGIGKAYESFVQKVFRNTDNTVFVPNGAYTATMDLLRENNVDVEEIGEEEKDEKIYDIQKIWEWIAKSMMTTAEFNQIMANMQAAGIMYRN